MTLADQRRADLARGQRIELETGELVDLAAAAVADVHHGVEQLHAGLGTELMSSPRTLFLLKLLLVPMSPTPVTNARADRPTLAAVTAAVSARITRRST